ncbi:MULTISPECIES: hypothetical protein [Vibrio]|uniref:hypothetical protein n=1 Tax=Vibrio TaxID=662 RepID=UPI00080427A2|nr:hypothetical protein [Vibrio natriegens]ANQ16848.1 hypothetical protein BA891_06280 [Vibrio natriegens]MEE3878119.1 hypothetical protein [Vibrio sp. YYF0003]
MELINAIFSFILDAGSTIAIALISSAFSVWLALSRYKSEKWWDKKLSCYSEIADSLSQVVIYADMVMDVELDNVEHAEDLYTAQKVKFNEALIKLQMHSHMGALFLDQKSQRVIAVFEGAIFRFNTSGEDAQKLSQLREVAYECLVELSRNAKKALKVKP